MGVVYKAHDEELDRDVALKFLPEHLLDSTSEESRLLQEARAAALLNHPNICGIHTLGEFHNRSFIDMEFVDGETLGNKIRRERLPMEDAIAYSIQIGEALQEAHSKGIVHQDIKADNVMVNSRNLVKVTDFGLAKLKGSLKPARTSTTEGTMAYMSPEQIQGEDVDARSDLFSLGVLLFHMLAGQLPFRGEHEAALMYSILNEEPQRLPAICPEAPGRVVQVIERALKKNRTERYQTATEMVADLRESLKGNAPDDLQMREDSPRRWLMRGKTPWLRPIVLIGLAIIIVALAVYFLRTPSPHAIDAIAVLPFINQSGDPAAEYLADGFTENLINSLSMLPSMKMMSRSSVFRFKGKDITPEKAAKELGVNAVITGRLSQKGEALSISVELLDVRDGSHIWGEQYERRTNQMQAIQSDIVHQVAGRLRLPLTSELQNRLSRSSTGSSEAYQSYLKGRFFLNKRTAEGFRKAMGFFQHAIEEDPSYPPAYAGLATVYVLQAAYDLRPPSESREFALGAAQQALQLDERSAEAHTVLASIPGFDWDADEQQYLKALELNPNYVTAQHWYGELLLQTGRFDQALTHLRKAVELDPLAPVHYVSLAVAFMVRHRDDEALDQLRKALDLDPRFPRAHAILAHLNLRMGKPDMALQSIDRAVQYSDSTIDNIGRRGLILGKTRRTAEAEKVLRQVLKRARNEYVPFSVIALPYIGLGRTGDAFRLLERACDEFETAMNDIDVDPLFESLRNDPRFVMLKRKIGLTGSQ